MISVYAVNFRGWPGLAHWKPPFEPQSLGTGCGSRVGLLLHAAVTGDPGQSEGAVGAYLLVSGSSIIEGGFIVPDGMTSARQARVREWAARNTVDTLQGPMPWCIRTFSEFFHPRSFGSALGYSLGHHP